MTTTIARVSGRKLEKLDEMRWIGDLPAIGHRTAPDRPALIFPERGKTLTYSALEQYSAAFAAELIERGLEYGDRIAYLGRNSDLFYVVMIGAIRAGVVLVPLNWRQSASEVSYQLVDSNTRLLLADVELDELAHNAVAEHDGSIPIDWIDGAIDGDNLRARVERSSSSPHIECRQDPEQTVIQVYTSGTSGQPKGVLISHQALSLARHAERTAPEWADWEDGGVTLSAMPNFHVGGISWVLMGLVRLSTVVITADPSPANMLRLIREFSVERSFIVPTVIRAIVDELHSSQLPAPNLKGIYYGAMPMSESLLREAMNLFHCKFGQFFGMTELTGTATYLPPEEHDLQRPHLLKSVGRPIAGMVLEIRDPNGNVLDYGQPGEIWIKAPTLMQGYWRQPEKTAEVVVDGWYATGDGGYLSEDGHLYLTDRIKDMIVSGGENIYPNEVEEALLTHSDVQSAAVVGLPDEHWGEVVVAVVELRSDRDVSEDELRTHVRSQVATYKCPKIVRFGQLPRTASGKLQRGQLRARLLASLQGDASGERE